MDADLISKLGYEKTLLTKDREIFSSKLKSLEPYKNCKLKKYSHKNGEAYYSMKSEGYKSYNYIGKASDLRVRRVQEVHHLEESIRRIDHDIELIDSLVHNYQPYDYLSVDTALPGSYQSCTSSSFTKYQVIGRKWKEEKLRFKAQFPENYPEYKTERTSDGVWVKSKNEVILYNKLLYEGLFHIYELPLPLADYGPPLYPDFTILSPIDMKTEIIIEHVGRLDNQQYRDDFARRLGRYIAAGYIPGVNLFFTFNDRNGHIDSLQINKIVADLYGIR